MKFRLATWNINSVRLRLALVERFVAAFRPDILCLQEIKCTEAAFPFDALKAMGFKHIYVNGQAGYHGVAILSRVKVEPRGVEQIGGNPDARHIAVAVADNRAILHNIYIPAGGDIPDREVNPKFGQKLDFLTALAKHFTGQAAENHILVGDFNVAPLPNDVWSHKQLLKVVSHTPIEVEHLARVQEASNWVDAIRKHVPEDEKLYTWWSYRAADWQESNRGRRLDHIWTTPGLAPAAKSMQIVTEARGWDQPSDHVPVIADFDLHAV